MLSLSNSITLNITLNRKVSFITNTEKKDKVLTSLSYFDFCFPVIVGWNVQVFLQRFIGSHLRSMSRRPERFSVTFVRMTAGSQLFIYTRYNETEGFCFNPWHSFRKYLWPLKDVFLYEPQNRKGWSLNDSTSLILELSPVTIPSKITLIGVLFVHFRVSYNVIREANENKSILFLILLNCTWETLNLYL